MWSLLPAESEGETGGDGPLDLETAVAQAERKTILRVLATAGDNKPEAARLLGIGERTLWSKLKKYGL